MNEWMKSSNFTAKGTTLRESMFEPFCVKVGWGESRLQGRDGKKLESLGLPQE